MEKIKNNLISEQQLNRLRKYYKNNPEEFNKCFNRWSNKPLKDIPKLDYEIAKKFCQCIANSIAIYKINNIKKNKGNKLNTKTTTKLSLIQEMEIILRRVKRKLREYNNRRY